MINTRALEIACKKNGIPYPGSGGQVVAAKRYYAAPRSELLTDMPKFSAVNGNVDVASALVTSRAMARFLVKNDGFLRAWIRHLLVNVVGPKGFKLQCRIMDAPGKVDRVANTMFEEAFAEWANSTEVEITGRFTFRKVQAMVLKAVATDGELYVRVVYGAEYRYGFTLQLLEGDMLDESYNVDLPNGNVVRMGIELTPQGKAVNYYFRAQKVLTNMYGGTYQTERVQVPADQIISVYDPDRVSSNRGVTWSVAGVIPAQFLQKFDEASLTNARIGAATGGFFENSQGDEYQGQDIKAASDEAQGDDVLDEFDTMEVAPGLMQKLPPGWKFTQFDPKFPSEQHGPFSEIILRRIAAALGIGYNLLANDLRGVNYSSLRHFSVSENDGWQMLQADFIESFLMPVYRVWLQMALLTQNVALPYSKLVKYSRVEWTGKTKGYFDPAKDAQADNLMLDMRVKTRQQVCREKFGMDFEDVLVQLAEERRLMEKYGIAEATPSAPSEQNGGASDTTSEQSGEEIDDLDAKE